MFSAEFQRNLWLEFSPLRLIAAPGIIGILVGLVFAIGDDSQGTGVTLYEFGSRAAYIALFIWGGWTAAGAVLGEISAQTWELQRMSALGAWSMTWGKLFGSTSYVWYVTAIMLAVAALGQSMGGDTLFDDESDGVLWAVDLVVSGLLVQASAFAAGLLLAGKIRGRQRGSVLMAWIIGLAAGFAAALLTAKIPSITALFELGVIESIYWYDGRYRLENLALFSMVLFTGFAIFAGYRLLRRELQFRSWPWGLPLFALVLIGYVSGFPAARLTPDQSFIGLLSTVALAVAVLFTYLSAFLDRNDPIRYRSLLTAFANGRFKEGLGLLPWWVPQFVLATIATLGICSSPRPVLPRRWRM